MARRLIYYVACTVDGFIAREDGAFDCFLFEGEHFPDLFMNFPETFPAHWRSKLGISKEAQCFDTVLMGRYTYEVGVREGITNPYAPLRQYVVSRTMRASPDPAVELHSGDPLDLVRSLKTGNGMDIWLCGGSRLAGALYTEIDELILKINPVSIGRGKPLFEGRAGTRRAALLEHHAYSNGFVLARYSLPQVE